MWRAPNDPVIPSLINVISNHVEIVWFGGLQEASDRENQGVGGLQDAPGRLGRAQALRL